MGKLFFTAPDNSCAYRILNRGHSVTMLEKSTMSKSSRKKVVNVAMHNKNNIDNEDSSAVKDIEKNVLHAVFVSKRMQKRNKQKKRKYLSFISFLVNFSSIIIISNAFSFCVRVLYLLYCKYNIITKNHKRR